VIFYDQRYILDLGILVLTYSCSVWGLRCRVGLAGLLDSAMSPSTRSGAYSYDLSRDTFGLSFWVCRPLAGILAPSGNATRLSCSALARRHSRYRDIGIREIIRLILLELQKVTGGPMASPDSATELFRNSLDQYETVSRPTRIPFSTTHRGRYFCFI